MTRVSATGVSVLAEFERTRMHRAMLTLVATCAAAAALTVWTHGDASLKYAHLIALGATCAVALTRIVVRRLPSRPSWFAVAFSAIASNTTALLYWGPLSAATLLMPLAAYAYTSGAGRKNMTGAGWVALVAHGTIVVGQIRGWFVVHSLVIPAAELTIGNQLGLLVLIQMLCLAAALGGLASHRTLARVIEDNANAQRSLAVRDAQVREARGEARDAKLGQGRWDGRQLGNYLLANVLGRGAMGEVYAATDPAGQRCAVKVIGRDHLHDPSIARRFRREVEVITKLHADNIVRLIDLSPLDAEVPYYVMELLEGSDLATLLATRARWSPSEALELVVQVAAGLEVAHAAGVVHRDLKPANIFAAGSTWKILDFGASKLMDGNGTLTHDQIIGTPSYMAPEQALGKIVDQRADLYSLGLVVYRVLTGAPAVPPDAIPGMLLETALKMPRRPGELAELNEDLDAMLAIALAKDPSERFATAGELARAYGEAVRLELDPRLRDRSRAILARAPWGTWIQDATRSLHHN